MIRFWQSLYIRTPFFYYYGGLVALFCLAFVWPVLFFMSNIMLAVFVAVALAEILWLYYKTPQIVCRRIYNQIFNLGSDNTVSLEIINNTEKKIKLTIIEELPDQLQIRDMFFTLSMEAKEEKTLHYSITPFKRGKYLFHNCNLYMHSLFGMFERKIIGAQPGHFSVYPSISHMKNFQLQSKVTIQQTGIKKIRNLGHSYEFDHIKPYVTGDDYRSINWKMTGKRHSLMVNQYDDERSQLVYIVLDTGRSMQMPFGGLSLLDYSINTGLVLAKTAIGKHDNFGIISYSKTIQTHLQSASEKNQLHKVFDHLYDLKATDFESDIETVYQYVRKTLRTRSVLFLFTNFESKYSLERAMPMLRTLNRMHLLVVVFYENDELKKLSLKEIETLDDIYMKALAEKLVFEKKQWAATLRQYGIQTILTQPSDLTINTINKYLELKSRKLA